MSAIDIRDVDVGDLEAITTTHGAAFPRSALTKLGAGALYRYYHWQLSGPHDAAARGAFLGRQLVGFCFGGVFQGALSGFLRRNRLFLLWRVATHPWLVREPLFRERLGVATRLLRGGSRSRSSSSQASEMREYSKETLSMRSFGILAIATHPRHQRKGIGRFLMEDAEAIARRKGFNAMHLTVEQNNRQAILFYETLGWTKVLDQGIWKGKMQKILVSDNP